MKRLLLAAIPFLLAGLSLQAQERDIQEELYQRTLVHPALDEVFNKHPLYAELTTGKQARTHQGGTDYIPVEQVFILKNPLIGFNYELIKFEELCEVVPINTILEHRIEHYIEFLGFQLMKDETMGAVSFVYRYPELFHRSNQALYGTIYFEKNEDGLWRSTDHYLHNGLYTLNVTK